MCLLLSGSQVILTFTFFVQFGATSEENAKRIKRGARVLIYQHWSIRTILGSIANERAPVSGRFCNFVWRLKLIALVDFLY